MTVSLFFVAVFAVTYSYTDLIRPKSVERQVDQAEWKILADRATQMGSSAATSPQVRQSAGHDAESSSGKFSICHTGGGVNCVVDGDTAWIAGVKVRIADIDAPETHPPRCDEEARLGLRATERLAELMNMGPFDLVVTGRAEDRYGRQLRVLMRDGSSLGRQLIKEGLARRWDGARRPWC
ncbi:thermonuclease family protein [Novosphingobium mangrovi (ex Hu et al. 2023)]|uniref:Thermonuclease family protein n=1 Tax=Novosphingobium mangrovi (ex Hu et al. 2023) TaxID=2930094 RepID=A0ABT0A916_9SPHN|nr:thermonuclease family protein [Novosphingobium mangrovi (ex Hu et al. 2023)]MCJ1959654.1 thermonuclease family protein [Novosphingobium mangrovi (ex Hu et al. 2023)]